MQLYPANRRGDQVFRNRVLDAALPRAASVDITRRSDVQSRRVNDHILEPNIEHYSCRRLKQFL